MARKDANRGKAEQAVERHIKAFELRKTGATYREIAAQLGVSVATVYEDCQRVLDELRGQALANASDYVALELERLDMAQFALFQHLETGDPSIVREWRMVSESRRKLLGLDRQPGAELPANLEIILRWHDDRRIIDITGTADHDHPAPAPQITESDSTAPRALPVHLRWATMGQESPSSDVEPEDGA